MKNVPDDVLNWVTDYYSGDVSKFILWDLSRAGLSDLSPDDIIRVVYEAKKKSARRAGDKTVLAVSRDVEFGIGRMRVAYSEIEAVEFELMTFIKLADAEKWLGV